MKRILAAAILAAAPALAHAQQPQVPAIEAHALASVSATVPSATTAPATQVSAPTSGTVPLTMPPPIAVLSPNKVPLNAKEQRAANISRTWRNRAAMPHAGEDGFVRYTFGATLPTVIGAPLQISDVQLQPGEIVNFLHLGDSERWEVKPALSGSDAGLITHLIIKPHDAGLVTSLTVSTTRRTYAIKLVSTQTEWTPLTAFDYPDDQKEAWENYRQTVGFGAAGSMLPTGESIANLQFLCISPASGGPSWAPIRAYTDGTKTYIEMPDSIGSQAAPALVALGHDGGWFFSPSTQVVNYRPVGNRYIVDAALDRAALIGGVGGEQQRVTITRGRNCR